jgi:DNA polymerase III sliding clamp (beta) subunit (PCNA family)
MTFRYADMIACVRVIDGTFPNWRQVVPKTTMQSFVIGENENKTLVKNLAKTLSMKNGECGTSVFFRDNAIDFATDNAAFVKEWGTPHQFSLVPLENNTTDDEMMFNGKYLNDALANTTGDVTIAFNTVLGPTIVTGSKNKKTMTVVMPMKRERAI